MKLLGVRPSVCHRHSPAACRCGGFAAGRPAVNSGGRPAANVRALSRQRLNTELFDDNFETNVGESLVSASLS